MTARMVVDNMISSKETGTQMGLESLGSSTLGQARSLVGRAREYATYTPTQPSVVKINHHNEAMMATMGLACIMSALKEASLVFTLTSTHYGRHQVKPLLKLGSEALAFIQGTGLDVTIVNYGLDLEADQLRLTFYRIFHVKNVS